MSLHIIILAAGNGKRMYSNTLKVLHTIGGKPMAARVVETALELKPDAIHIIHGHKGEELRDALSDYPINWIKQEQQLGTGHAVLQAMPFIPEAAKIIILSGDVPLIEAATLSNLMNALDSHVLALLIAKLDNPTGLGRILRNANGAIQAIREEKDANNEEKKIQDIYSGICAVKAEALKHWLPNISNDNAQKEYYLTDILSMAVHDEEAVTAIYTSNLYEIQGVNNRLQLQQLERIWQRNTAIKLLDQGVGIADADRIDIRGDIFCAFDVFIDINCVFTGQVTIGEGTIIEPNCTITNTTIGKNCTILANSVIDGACIADDCSIGPFARLRRGTILANYCKIGNFVETKKANFQENSKASHLSYLGDCNLGRDVNIGAGTITCNYDGVNKHQTTIEDGVFVGSGTQFVAPVTAHAGATIGAGSTIRKDVPPDALTLTERKQRTIFGWARPIKLSD